MQTVSYLSKAFQAIFYLTAASCSRVALIVSLRIGLHPRSEFSRGHILLLGVINILSKLAVAEVSLNGKMCGAPVFFKNVRFDGQRSFCLAPQLTNEQITLVLKRSKGVMSVCITLIFVQTRPDNKQSPICRTVAGIEIGSVLCTMIHVRI